MLGKEKTFGNCYKVWRLQFSRSAKKYPAAQAFQPVWAQAEACGYPIFTRDSIGIVSLVVKLSLGFPGLGR
jgi:hypothetical protein